MPKQQNVLTSLAHRQSQIAAQLATVEHAKPSFRSENDRAILLYQTSLRAKIEEHIIIRKILTNYGKSGYSIPEA